MITFIMMVLLSEDNGGVFKLLANFLTDG
nr:hypothetical protein LRH_09003 [Lacticaseibacillus rhamnosus HN001]